MTTTIQSAAFSRQETLLETLQFPVEDELVVVRRDVEGVFLLNSTARLLWEELRAGASVEEAVRAFVTVYPIPESVARQDIEGMLAEWSKGLLGPEPPNKRATGRSDSPVRAGRMKSGALVMGCRLNNQIFRVILEGSDLAEEIAPRLVWTAISSLDGPPVSTFTLSHIGERIFVFRDQVCIAEEETIAAARTILLQEMTELCEPGREVRAILHAGACGSDSGSVLLAGASHAGKSTLCAALMAEGLRCYSDDSAMLDREFRVAGMPFPITLRQSSWPVLASRYDSIGRAGIHRGAGITSGLLPSNLPDNRSTAAAVKALVFLKYTQADTKLESLTAFESLVALQQSGFWVKHERESIAEFLGWLCRVPRYNLTYSSIDDAVNVVHRLLR